MEIDKYRIKVNGFSVELDKPLDRNLRTMVSGEMEIYEVSTPDNQDGTFSEVYKCKLVGSSLIKQAGSKHKGGKSNS